MEKKILAERNIEVLDDVIVSKKDDFDNNRFARKQRTREAYPDITSMLKVSGDIIDRSYIKDWANRLEL